MIFSVENGCFGYGRPLLKDIHFSVESGRVLSILGPNGAGKTTLLRCMLGFLKWSSGGAFIDGRDLRTMSRRDIWRRAAYVPQRGDAGPYTAGEMVLMGRAARLDAFAQPGAEDEKIALAAMERLGVASLRDMPCACLSGGEFRMTLIARALCAEPELLILDEPESGLDFKNQWTVLHTLERLARDSGLAVILNTHHPEHALRVSDHALLLGRGGVNFYGPAAEAVTEENMFAAFGVQVLIRDVPFGEVSYKSVIPVFGGAAAWRSRNFAP